MDHGIQTHIIQKREIWDIMRDMMSLVPPPLR